MTILAKEQKNIERFLLLSIAAAIFTIALKAAAAVLTGSVGFLSDALESGVNLIAVVVALIAIRIAAKPADANHNFGHGKSEYVSALVEGAMIFVAAAMIIYTAIGRLLDPSPLEQVGVGLFLSVAATLINLGVGLALLRAGKQYRSAALDADGRHLLTDVWTTAGVVAGIAAVALTGWIWLDPVIALLVGVNILWTGYKLLNSSLSNLISEALPLEDVDVLKGVLTDFEQEHGVSIEDLRTVASGRQRLVYLTMTVPGDWTVEYAHELADALEAAILDALPNSESMVHTEPRTLATA
ncbi:cation diffusion facilitator family transporter [Corynebacterium casei]|uniref:cation diffusion facilitator family transporter n=1 Tax=Corynebacterium casei TaxID=160386 RepID=UPI003FD5F325